MPASLQEVKRRIVSTKKTGQITSAMQMVSTAKLSQIQKHSVSYQVYASKIRSVITHLAQSHLLDSASVSETGKDQAGKLNTLGMLKQRPVKKIGIVVVTLKLTLVPIATSSPFGRPEPEPVISFDTLGPLVRFA